MVIIKMVENDSYEQNSSKQRAMDTSGSKKKDPEYLKYKNGDSGF